MSVMSYSLRCLAPLFFLILLIAPACSHDPAEKPTDDPATFGPWDVGHMTFDAVDENRGDRTLHTDVWYPVDPEDAVYEPLTIYPLSGPLGLDAEIAVDDLPVSSRPMQKLVVFSHGYGGTNTQSTPLMETLASHGFIVVSPEHTGNTATSNPPDSDDVAAAKRVPDVTFIIDYMLARNDDPVDPFFDRIHPSRIGVAGHSFGGTTSIGMAAGWAGAEPDTRVVAIVPISGDVDGRFSRSQLRSIQIPTMLIGGTEDASVPIEDNELAFNLIPGNPVYRVDIVGANHTHFANVCAIGNFLIEFGIAIENWAAMGAAALVQPYLDTCTPEAFPIDEAITLQNLYTVAFFKRHLQDVNAYSYYLKKSYAYYNEPDVIFSVMN